MMAIRGGNPAPKANKKIQKEARDAVECIEFNRKNPGRPSLWHDGFLRFIEKYVQIGAIEDGIADLLGISESTLGVWKVAHPELLVAIKRARDNDSAEVAKFLRHRATGYSHPAVKIFCTKDGDIVRAPYTEHYPPDATSLIFYLKNRDPEHWKDRVEGQGPTVDDAKRALRESLAALDETVPTEREE